MQGSVFNLLFQFNIYHHITSNNYNNAVSSVLLLYSDTPGVALKEEEPYIAQFLPGKIN